MNVLIYEGEGRPGHGVDLMGWLYVDDAFVDSPRLVQAGELIGSMGEERALAVWMRTLAYSRKHLCGGELRGQILARLIRDRRPRRIMDAMVEAGLWEASGDGIRIRGYSAFYGDDATAAKNLDRRRRRPRSGEVAGVQASRAGSRAVSRAGSRDTDTDT